MDNIVRIINKGYHPDITVSEWILIINHLSGKCSKLCNTCKRTWHEIGTGGVHMRENTDYGRRSCDMVHVFDCDECYEKRKTIQP